MQEQQEFLRQAMQQLALTRDGLAGRLSVTRRALDAWLLPAGSSEFRSMPEVVGKFIGEIIESHPMTKYTQSVYSARSRFFDPDRPALLSVDQFSLESIDEVFRVARLLEPVARRQKITDVLAGAVLGNLFFEASTRTRVSFGSAFCRLGGSVCDTTGFTFSSMAKGESIYDTSRVISGYVDALVVRHPEQGSVAEFAAATNIPVINAGDGPGEHPTQALLDLYTIATEFSRSDKVINGSHIALVGDLRFGRTVHSLMKLMALYENLRFTLIAPPELQMPTAIVERVEAAGHRVTFKSSLEGDLSDVDVLYATRLQRERFPEQTNEGFEQGFQIDLATLERAFGRNTLVMHPLPRDSREGARDLSADLNADPRLAIFRQTDNGIPVRMALFAMMLGVDRLIAASLRDATWRRPTLIGPDDTSFERSRTGQSG
jgi:aspartate carbamoyltransferase catalytic subunit